VGAGNMAEALVGGMIQSGVCRPNQVVVSDVRADRIAYFARQFGVDGVSGNVPAVKGADIVVLAVKPQVLDAVLAEMGGAIEKGALVVSIAAGVPTSRIEGVLGEGARVVRAMPNTPALVRAGAAALCAGRWATEEDLQTAESLLGAVGVAVRVAEDAMDAVTAVSGSGPAYVFYIVEAMLAAAAHLGLPDGVARQLVYATIGGSARLLTETGIEPAELRRRVTSKGGTTAAALAVLDERKVAAVFAEAIRAAHKRAGELSQS